MRGRRHCDTAGAGRRVSRCGRRKRGRSASRPDDERVLGVREVGDESLSHPRRGGLGDGDEVPALAAVDGAQEGERQVDAQRGVGDEPRQETAGKGVGGRQRRDSKSTTAVRTVTGQCGVRPAPVSEGGVTGRGHDDSSRVDRPPRRTVHVRLWRRRRSVGRNRREYDVDIARAAPVDGGDELLWRAERPEEDARVGREASNRRRGGSAVSRPVDDGAFAAELSDVCDRVSERRVRGVESRRIEDGHANPRTGDASVVNAADRVGVVRGRIAFWAAIRTVRRACGDGQSARAQHAQCRRTADRQRAAAADAKPGFVPSVTRHDVDTPVR